MGLFRGLFGKKDNEEKRQLGNIAKETVLQYLTNDSREQDYCTARCKDGEVFLCGRFEGNKVGSYEKDENGMVIVWTESHVCRIGKIHEAEKRIYLTAEDSYNYFKNMNPYVKTPPFSWLAAFWNGNSIFDGQTGKQIARFQGNAVEAAAAFVCLVEAELNYNKYHEYFHAWH